MRGFPGGLDSKKKKKSVPSAWDLGFIPWVRKIPWRREWLPTPVFLSGEFHTQRSLAGYSPWGRKREQPNSGNKNHGTSQGTSINPQKEAQRKELLLKQHSKGHPCLFLLFPGREEEDLNIFKCLKQNEVETVWFIWLLHFFSCTEF